MPPVLWLWTVVSWLTALGLFVVAVMAVCLYRAKRTRPFGLLMWACICLLIAHSSGFVFFILGSAFLSFHSTWARLWVSEWGQWTESTFLLLFVGLLIVTLLSFLRERSYAATPGI
jgi:hypothetical protein